MGAIVFFQWLAGLSLKPAYGGHVRSCSPRTKYALISALIQTCGLMIFAGVTPKFDADASVSIPTQVHDSRNP